MTKVTVTVETDRYSSVTRTDADEAEALASCIYQIAEFSSSPRVAAIAAAVYRAMATRTP